MGGQTENSNVLVRAQSAGSPRPRLRVLILAYACGPNRGSESGVGWHRVLEISKYCDIWVLCEKHEFETTICDYIQRNGLLPGLKFLFVPRHPWEKALQQIYGLYYVFYSRWHRRAFRIAQQAHAELKFDCAHQLNMCGYREPGYLWKLNVPFVWGPIGGTQNYPWRFLPQAGLRGAILEAIRNVANRLQLRFGRRPRQAGQRASVVLAANSSVQRDIAVTYGFIPKLMLETGIDAIAATRQPRDPMRRKVRILWSGPLETRKALPLLLKALARLPSNVFYEVRILGSGPRENQWRRLSHRLGIDKHVVWLGFLPHDQVYQYYSWADMFVFTSLRDTSGNVVLEAMASGLPVICLDHQGVRDMVTEECGVKIPVTTPNAVIRGLCEAITNLAGDPNLCERLSQGAFRRAEDYSWEDQAKELSLIYDRVVAIGLPNAIGRKMEDATIASSTGEMERACKDVARPVIAPPCGSIP